VLPNLEWDHVATGATEAELGALEARVGRLTEPYRRFLVQHDGGRPATNLFAVPGANTHARVHEFFGTRRILEEIAVRAGRLPESVVPVAADDCGNLVVLDNSEGCVLFWDHELEATSPFFALASDFERFLQLIAPDNGTVILEPGQVIRAWIDPGPLESPDANEPISWIPTQPSSSASRAFCACSRFSASSHTADFGP
jgi:hypothetical protein